MQVAPRGVSNSLEVLNRPPGARLESLRESQRSGASTVADDADDDADDADDES